MNRQQQPRQFRCSLCKTELRAWLWKVAAGRQRSCGLRLRTCALQVRLRLRSLGIIDAGIDLIERLALSDDRAFLEKPAQDDAADLRSNVGDLESRHSAREVLNDRRAALLDDDESDDDWALGPSSAADPALLGFAAPASGQGNRGRNECGQDCGAQRLGNGEAHFGAPSSIILLESKTGEELAGRT